MKIRNLNINNKTLLILIIAFGIALRLAFDIGVISSGDLGHITYSYKASTGNFRLSAEDTQTASRIAFIYPVAFFYRIFGVNEFSAYAYSLILSIGSIILIYLLGKLFFGEKVGLISAFLLSFYPLNVNYSTRAYPDLAQAFFMGLAVYLFFLGEKKIKISQQITLYFLAGIVVGLAALTKESGIIILLFFTVFILYKLIFKKERIRGAYALMLVGVASVLVLQIALSYLTSGDPFLRYKQIDNFYYGAIKNLYNYQGYKLIERLLIHMPYLMLTDVNFGFFTVFFIMALAYVITFKKRGAYPIAIWFVSLFLYLNFGSTSLTGYVPLPGGTPRYLEVLTFPGILALSFFLSEKGLPIRRFILPFSIIFLFVTSIGLMYINPDRDKQNINKEIAEFLKTQKDLVIYADSGTADLLSFYTQYNKDVRAFWKANYPRTGSFELVKPEDMKNAYVVVNKDYFNRIPKNYNVSLPKIYYEVPKNWVLLNRIENKNGDELVYYAP